MVVGSPGGSAIINYVAKTLVGVLDWGLDIQAAISLPNMGSRNKDTELEKGTALEAGARAGSDGHPLRITEFPSGIHGIVIGRTAQGRGSAPRRPGAGGRRAAAPRARASRPLVPGRPAPAAAAQPGGRARQLDRRAHAPVVALFQQHAAMAGM